MPWAPPFIPCRSEGSDLMTYISDNYTSYSAPSRLSTLSFSVIVLVLVLNVATNVLVKYLSIFRCT